MMLNLRAAAAAIALLIAILGGTASAQKPGGILRMSLPDSPPNLSMLEGSDFVQAMMGMFNNLVLFNQHVKQNSMQSIVPDLASGWSWSEEGTQLTVPLRQGVKWHDGKPFTARDVKCTWDLLTGRLALKISTRDFPVYRDPAVILTDQLKEVYIDGELDIVETASWFPKVMRKDYLIGLNATAAGVDDPDQQLYENYACGSPRNYTGYCDHEQAVRPAISGIRSGKAQAAGMGNRKKISGRRCPAGYLLHPISDVPAALCQRGDDHGQQHL